MEPEPDLMRGARVAVGQCLAVTPHDRVFVMTDEATSAIGGALVAAATEVGASAEVVTLERYGQRPFTDVPAALMDDLAAFGPSVTFFAASGQPGEIRFRIPLGKLLRASHTVRHGHMIGITRELMVTGMTADYGRIAERTAAVNARVAGAREIHVTNADGTDFRVALAPGRLRWCPCTGLLHSAGDWGNLPEGETFTSPAGAEGTLTANVLGDYFSARYGLLTQPAVFTVADARVTSVEHPNQALADDVWGYLTSADNGTRVGEFAIGTNEAVTALTGNLLQDEKFPGVHVAFGNPYPDLTGADWSSEVHVDVVPLRVNIFVDGDQIMEEGVFTL